MKTYRKRIRQIATAAAVIGAQLPFFQAMGQEVSKEEVQTLIRKVQDLEQKVKILERNRELDRDAAIDKTATEPVVSLGAKGLLVRSGDTNFVMNVHGYAQTDARFYLHDPNTANDTFLLRRVRPIIEGSVYNRFDYRLMLDLATGNVTGSTAGNNALIDDAYVNARLFPQFQLQVGKYKSPVGLERLKSTADLTFVETGFATQLTPNYDTGIELHNDLFNTPVNYAIGVFNGAADAGSDDLDAADQGKDVAGRVFLQPFLNSGPDALRGLGVGVGASSGYHAGALPGYKTPGQQTFFSYAATASANGVQYRLDPQAFYYWGPFGLLGEYILSSQQVQSTAAGVPKARLNHTAWQVTASYFLTGEDNTFKTPNPARRFSLQPGGGWGAFEVAARVGQLSLDRKTFPSYAAANTAREATSWGVGLNWYLNTNVKLNLDYESTKYQGGSVVPGTVTSREEHAILSRVQVAF